MLVIFFLPFWNLRMSLMFLSQMTGRAAKLPGANCFSNSFKRKTRSMIQAIGLVGGAIALTATPSIAEVRQHSSLQLAQRPGECRLVNRSMGIYEEPRTDSTARGLVRTGDVVVLGNGSELGWARVTSPVVGWLDARNLRVIECPMGGDAPVDFPQPTTDFPQPTNFPQPTMGDRPPEPAVDQPVMPAASEPATPARETTPAPDTPANQCAVVTYPGTEGLAIYADTADRMTALGQVIRGDRVLLTGERVIDPMGRRWVQVNLGNRLGWLAETGATGVNSGFNIRRVPCGDFVG